MDRSLSFLRKIHREFPAKFLDITRATNYDFSANHGAPTHGEAMDATHNRIVVINEDCLRVTDGIVRSNKYGHPLLLNMANAYYCGGEGFHSPDGKGSQEEYLFRHTTLVASLWPRRRSNDNRWKEANDLFERGPARYEDIYYPFTSAGGVYSPEVIIHGIEYQPIPLNMMQSCAVVSIAAQDLRPSRTFQTEEVFDYQLTVEKIRTCLYIAVANGHRVLILGPIGCGAFMNPRDQIAQAFHELLHPDGEFGRCFDLVVFSVIKDPHNLHAFEQVFGPRVSFESIL